MFDQDDTSLSPRPQEHRSSTVPERSQQLTTAQLATHEREHPAREAMQGAFYDTIDDVRASASGDPWTAPQGAFASEHSWRRSKAPIELNIIKKANSVRANQLRDRTEICYDPYAIDRAAPAVLYGIPYDDATKIDVYG